MSESVSCTPLRQKLKSHLDTKIMFSFRCAFIYSRVQIEEMLHFRCVSMYSRVETEETLRFRCVSIYSRIKKRLRSYSNQRPASRGVTPLRPAPERGANFKRGDGGGTPRKSTASPSPNNTVFFQRIGE